MMFPWLMLVIVLISMLANSSRTEQALQSAANRAAQVASICCPETGEAADVARASLEAAAVHAGFNRVTCNNDLTDSNFTSITFTDVAGEDVPEDPSMAMPPGGVVTVDLRCRILPQNLGGAGVPGLVIERGVRGVASIDPYRFRSGT